MKFIIGGALVAIIVGYLGFQAFSKASVYYYTVPEAVQQKTTLNAKDFRVDGWVKANSIDWNPQATMLNFTITDDSGKYTFPVSYKGIKPDNMTDPELQVIVEGRFDQDNVFQAHTLLTRCPSKYEDKQPETASNAGK